MPTLRFNSIEEVYTALTDLEIEDDSSDGVPLAEIKVKGLHRIKVGMVSEWDYYKYLEPLKNAMFTYYAQSIVKAGTEEELKKATKKLKTIQEELTDLKPGQIKEKASNLLYFFEDRKVRYLFFRGLKKLKVIKWWVSWNRWQKCISRHHTLIIFIMLWAFNFDGFKKKTIRLLESVNSIYARTNSQSPIVSNNFTDFATFQKIHQAGHERLQEKLQDNSNN